MKRTPWFERTFSGPPDLGAFASVVERVRGTPARLAERLEGIAPALLTRQIGGRWSIQENIGHLGDLEPLWAGRLMDLVEGKDELRPADLENRATFEADHNTVPIATLLANFRVVRKSFVQQLEKLDTDQVARSAQHPRLQHPMSTLDLCLFIAEHDDHHLASITEIVQAGRS